ncbi:MAG: hypothetical protein EAZ43_14240 [Betaproteobacteria bacterium]|nr:MAG: hypothetical protein EAZ43_14240 [Betaproteobacteria bacterium]
MFFAFLWRVPICSRRGVFSVRGEVSTGSTLKATSPPFVVSLSNHERTPYDGSVDLHLPLWFDKLTTNGKA